MTLNKLINQYCAKIMLFIINNSILTGEEKQLVLINATSSSDRTEEVILKLISKELCDKIEEGQDSYYFIIDKRNKTIKFNNFLDELLNDATIEWDKISVQELKNKIKGE